MPSAVDVVLDRNRAYAEGFSRPGLPGRPPRLRLAVLTCLDCRLHVPELLSLELDDAHILRHGASWTRPGCTSWGCPSCAAGSPA